MIGEKNCQITCCGKTTTLLLEIHPQYSFCVSIMVGALIYGIYGSIYLHETTELRNKCFNVWEMVLTSCIIQILLAFLIMMSICKMIMSARFKQGDDVNLI